MRLPGGAVKILKCQPKPHKLPICPKTGNLASTTRKESWSSLATASAAFQQYSLTGVGFVFTDSDPYSGVDLDNCRNAETGEITEWAWEIIRALNSYTEVSPSGTGVHIIVRGSLPQGKGNQATCHGGKVEMFSRCRYFTFTGQRVANTPADISDRSSELLSLHERLFPQRKTTTLSAATAAYVSDTEVIAKARRAKNGAKFDRLWNGQWESEYPSQSEADCALCSILAFWVGNDSARIDSLFRQSGLMRSDRWERQSYREGTITAALRPCPQLDRRTDRDERKQSGADKQASSQVLVEQKQPKLSGLPDTFVDLSTASVLAITSLSQIPSVFGLESKLNWRVEGMIAQGSITMICAESGTGKTWFGYYLAGCVANNIPVLGQPVLGCKVLYLDGENPLYVAKQRLKDLGILDSADLKMWGGWNTSPPPGPSDSLVIDFAREHKGLILYDSLIEFHSGSEQSSTETRSFMRHFRHLANLGASVIVLHHSGKAETSKLYRGSSDIKAAVDTAYALTRTGPELAELGDLALTCFKGRLAPGRNFSMRFKKGAGFLPTAGREHRRDATEVLAALLADAPNSNQSQIVALAKKQGLAKGQVEACLRDGAWTKRPGPNNSTLYSLGTEETEDYASAN